MCPVCWANFVIGSFSTLFARVALRSQVSKRFSKSKIKK